MSRSLSRHPTDEFVAASLLYGCLTIGAETVRLKDMQHLGQSAKYSTRHIECYDAWDKLQFATLQVSGRIIEDEASTNDGSREAQAATFCKVSPTEPNEILPLTIGPCLCTTPNAVVIGFQHVNRCPKLLTNEDHRLNCLMPE
jgi:hypothetical protein